MQWRGRGRRNRIGRDIGGCRVLEDRRGGGEPEENVLAEVVLGQIPSLVGGADEGAAGVAGLASDHSETTNNGFEGAFLRQWGVAEAVVEASEERRLSKGRASGRGLVLEVYNLAAKFGETFLAVEFWSKANRAAAAAR